INIWLMPLCAGFVAVESFEHEESPVLIDKDKVHEIVHDDELQFLHCGSSITVQPRRSHASRVRSSLLVSRLDLPSGGVVRQNEPSENTTPEACSPPSVVASRMNLTFFLLIPRSPSANHGAPIPAWTCETCGG